VKRGSFKNRSAGEKKTFVSANRDDEGCDLFHFGDSYCSIHVRNGIHATVGGV
jgi:hypothetical protein